MAYSVSIRATLGLTVAMLMSACGVGSSSATTPGSSPEPTTRSASPPSVAPSSATASCPPGGHMSPGTYAFSALDTQTVPAAITVPGGWNGCGLMTKEFGEPARPALIAFWSVANVYVNPCHWRGSLLDPAVGPAIDDLTKALVDQEVTAASAPATDAIGGFTGKYVRLSVPLDADVTACDSVKIAEFRLLDGPGESVWWLGAADAPGLIGEVWIVDVKGARVVVQAAYHADNAQPEIDEIHGIVRSISFQP